MNWLVVAWNGESPCLCRQGRLFRVGRMIAPTSSYPNPNPEIQRHHRTRLAPVTVEPVADFPTSS